MLQFRPRSCARRSAPNGESRLKTADTDCAPRWRSCKPETIAWVGWDDDFVAFHRPSGGTHFLNRASRTLLDDILAEPKDLAMIAAALAAVEPDTETELDPDVIRSMLDRFEELGLVERV